MDHRCLSINKHWILTVGIEILRTRGSVKQPRWSDDSSGNVPTCVQMSQSKSGGCGEMPHEDCSPEIDLGENCSCGSCSEGEMFQLRSHSGRELSFSHWRQVARLEPSVKRSTGEVYSCVSTGIQSKYDKRIFGRRNGKLVRGNSGLT